ncbi:hypothetical protein V8F33_013709 [Rhypophila sp. PSN 637]
MAPESIFVYTDTSKTTTTTETTGQSTKTTTVTTVLSDTKIIGTTNATVNATIIGNYASDTTNGKSTRSPGSDPQDPRVSGLLAVVALVIASAMTCHGWLESIIEIMVDGSNMGMSCGKVRIMVGRKDHQLQTHGSPFCMCDVSEPMYPHRIPMFLRVQPDLSRRPSAGSDMDDKAELADHHSIVQRKVIRIPYTLADVSGLNAPWLYGVPRV